MPKAIPSPRLVTWAGVHDGKTLFVTPSWSGKNETYEILVDPETWMVKCNCFGSNRWSLFSDLMHPEMSHGCKHSREVAKIVQRHLDEVRNG